MNQKVFVLNAFALVVLMSAVSSAQPLEITASDTTRTCGGLYSPTYSFRKALLPFTAFHLPTSMSHRLWPIARIRTVRG